jgi:RNA polymerase sigma factor (sigma-70 family)
LATVFDATSKELLDVACHLVRDPSAAEDLVQATFLTAIRKADQFDGRSPLKGWLYGILWREAAKHRRSTARRIDARELTERESIDPSDEVEAAEVSIAIHRALDELPRRYRDVLLPLVRDGKGADDIARDLNRSPGTVRSQIHRGMRRLRRALPIGMASSPAWVGARFRGLAEVRSHVLTSAGCSSAATAASSAAVFSRVLGGALMTKTMLLGSGVLIAGFAAGWFGRELASPEAKREAAATDRSSRTSAAPSQDAHPSDAPHRDRADAQERRALAQDPVVAKQSDPADAVSYWLARFNEKPDDAAHGLAVATEISKLDPDEALRIVRGVWKNLTVPVKQQVIRPFAVRGGHVHVLPILDLLATDSSVTDKGEAFFFLKDYSFRDFATDYDGYLIWAAAYRDLPLNRVLTENAQRFVTDLLPKSAREIGAALLSIRGLNFASGSRVGVDVVAEIKRDGGLHLLETCIQSEDLDAHKQALEWARQLRPDESWLRSWVMPAIDSPQGVHSDVLVKSFLALARPDCGFARDPILDYMRRGAGYENHSLPFAAQALAGIGDPVAIPAMIELLLQDKSGKLNYDVGYFGLSKLAGVKWDKGYDGEWWLNWWTKNQGRFPPEVVAIPIRR